MTATPIQIPWGTGLGKGAVELTGSVPRHQDRTEVAAFVYERADGTLDGYAIESLGSRMPQRFLSQLMCPDCRHLLPLQVTEIYSRSRSQRR